MRTESARDDERPPRNEALASLGPFQHRQQLVRLPEFGASVLVWEFQARPARSLAVTLAYLHKNPSRGKRTGMDVERVAMQWRDLIVQTVTAHTKDDWDRADYEADQFFGPILTAPIVEVRRFTARLSELLEADESVPFRVWAGFKNINEVLIQTVEDAGVMELKTRLARQVAEMAEESVPPGDWVDAITDALQWRDPEDLTTMKEALESGKRPRVRGRESCLFLVVDEGEPSECVVML